MAFHTVIVEYIIHSGIRNYTKLACNSLKIIPNDTVSQQIRQGDDDQHLIHKLTKKFNICRNSDSRKHDLAFSLSI